MFFNSVDFELFKLRTEEKQDSYVCFLMMSKTLLDFGQHHGTLMFAFCSSQGLSSKFLSQGIERFLLFAAQNDFWIDTTGGGPAHGG